MQERYNSIYHYIGQTRVNLGTSNEQQHAVMSSCHLRLLQSKEGEEPVKAQQNRSQAIAIVTELGTTDNPGMSVTTSAVWLAEKIVADFELDPATSTFIECYNAQSYDGCEADEPERYNQVTFTWNEHREASHPKFKPLQPGELTAFFGGGGSDILPQGQPSSQQPVLPACSKSACGSE